MNLYLLGAKDPEMERILARLEQTSNEVGRNVFWATKDGNPVHPGNSYKADSVEMGNFDTLVCIECRPESLPEKTKLIVIDHHRPGDPGFDLGPSQFWEASSLGQVCKLLGLKPIDDDLLIAATDHCFAAANRGECPGIVASDVLRTKLTFIAHSKNASELEVYGRVRDYEFLLANAPEITIGSQVVKDLRDTDLGEGYSLDLLCVQVAATIKDWCVLLRHRDRAQSPEKNSITGNATPETVKIFMDEWAPSQGLFHIYGVPNRGYAGGYVAQ